MRHKYDFNQGWQFCYGDKPSGNPYYSVNLPHTVRIEPIDCSDCTNYVGKAIYRKWFAVPNECRGQKLYIEFEGAMQEAHVYLNETCLGVHYGGYLPFTFDITDVVNMDRDNLVTVYLDNSDNILIPPGRNQAGLDFCYFGGLYRNVNLYACDRLHITDELLADDVAGGGIFVTFDDVSEKNARVQVKVQVANEYAETVKATVTAEIIDKNADVVAECSKQDIFMEADSTAYSYLTLHVANPNLWSHLDPYLYTLRVSVSDENTVKDVREIRIGIRDFVFNAKDGFILNGKKVFLNGSNRHQEYAHIGYAMPDSMQYRDAVMMKEIGFNFCRIGHYPNSKSFMDALDELGIMSLVPTPGWHFCHDDPIFRARVINDIRQMIRLNRNRPGVLFWEPILNESFMPEDFIKECYNTVHEEFPTEHCYAACDPYMSKDYDILYGWQSIEGKVTFSREYNDALEDQNYSLLQRNDENLAHFWCARSSKNAIIGGEKGQLLSCRDRWNNGGLRTLNGHYGLSKEPGFSGMCIWSFNDYNRGFQTVYSASGIVDLYRLPKFSYYMFRAQRDPDEKFKLDAIDYGPMVFIASYWNRNSSPDITVFSNCDEVEILLNGEVMDRKAKSENFHAPHPPFSFHLGKFTPGTLTANGYIGGKLAATHSVTTARKPSYIEINPMYRNKMPVASGEDVLNLYAIVKDADGNTCYDYEENIRFRVSGNARIVGDGDERIKTNPMMAMSGIAPLLLYIGDKNEEICVSAEGDGNIRGEFKFTPEVYTRPVVASSRDMHLPPAPSTNESYVKPCKDVYLQNEDWCKGKPACASSYAEGHEPSFANNGDKVSKWIASDTQTPAYWQCDLETERWITGLVLAWENDRTYYMFDVFSSHDGTNWEKVLSETESGQDYTKLLKMMAKGRYLKIVVNEVHGPGKIGLSQVTVL